MFTTAGDRSGRKRATRTNLSGVTGGVVGGSGTLNTIPKWTPNGVTLGDSILTDAGIGEVGITGNLIPDTNRTIGKIGKTFLFVYADNLDSTGADSIQINTPRSNGDSISKTRMTFNSGSPATIQLSKINVESFGLLGVPLLGDTISPAFTMNSGATLSSGNLLRVQNNTVDKFTVDFAGVISRGVATTTSFGSM